MIGYISLMRDTGKRAWIMATEVAAIAENETKVGKDIVPCTTVLLRNNVAWHFPGVTGPQMIQLLRSAAGDQVNVITEDALPA